MLWRVMSTDLNIPWRMAAARVVERPDVEGGHFSRIIDVEGGPFHWIVEAPRGAGPVLLGLAGVVAAEPIPDLADGPGERAA